MRLGQASRMDKILAQGITPNAMLRLGCDGFRWDVVQDEQNFNGDRGEGIPVSIGVAKFDQARRRGRISRIGLDHGAYGTDLETGGEIIALVRQVQRLGRQRLQ
jgi:hypothetical protein